MSPNGDDQLSLLATIHILAVAEDQAGSLLVPPEPRGTDFWADA